MYGKVVQIIACKNCHMRNMYPACTACEQKAEFDNIDRRCWRALFRSLFEATPFLKKPEHPSRWREERYSGKTIRVPLFYG
jgi:hypothetical protein